jgi:glycosyltransferase involved in cell wall biosynthesis
MKNLIFFLPSFSYYGAGNSTLRLCKTLDKKNYQISIISLGKNFQKSKLKKIGCKIFEINSNNVFRSMKLIIPLVNKIYEAKMDKNIFISSIHHANVFSIIFLRTIKNLKIIGIERTDINELLIFDNLFNYIKNLLIYLLVKIYYKKADLIISNSIRGKNDLIKLCKTKVLNIPSPSFLSLKFKKPLKKIKKLKIISVGRLSKEKGYDVIIKALSKLQIKDFSLTILGDGPEKENLKTMIKDYNLQKKIKLVGFKRYTSKYYKKANLFINASHFEGFPNAVVEAISHNLPVICSNSKGGIKEIILNGRGGDLFRVNDSNQLSKKITSYYRDPKKLNRKLILSRNNIKKYSISEHVKKYHNIFNNI